MRNIARGVDMKREDDHNNLISFPWLQSILDAKEERVELDSHMLIIIKNVVVEKRFEDQNVWCVCVCDLETNAAEI
jgi:hypothetical protein